MRYIPDGCMEDAAEGRSILLLVASMEQGKAVLSGGSTLDGGNIAIQCIDDCLYFSGY